MHQFDIIEYFFLLFSRQLNEQQKIFYLIF